MPQQYGKSKSTFSRVYEYWSNDRVDFDIPSLDEEERKLGQGHIRLLNFIRPQAQNTSVTINNLGGDFLNQHNADDTAHRSSSSRSKNHYRHHYRHQHQNNHDHYYHHHYHHNHRRCSACGVQDDQEEKRKQEREAKKAADEAKQLKEKNDAMDQRLKALEQRVAATLTLETRPFLHDDRDMAAVDLELASLHHALAQLEAARMPGSANRSQPGIQNPVPGAWPPSVPPNLGRWDWLA